MSLGFRPWPEEIVEYVLAREEHGVTGAPATPDPLPVETEPPPEPAVEVAPQIAAG